MKGKKVLVTGGLGFIGSNLAIKLVEMGAKVTIVDAMIPSLGGNDFNVEPIRGKARIVKSDLRSFDVACELVKNQDFVFHLAGQVDHHRSMEFPEEDLSLRCQSTINLLEALRSRNPKARLVFSSTRAVYGSPESLPVRETSSTVPKGMYAVTSLAAEKLIIIYHRLYNIPATILRITNGYGPRQQMRKPYGVVNWFIRRVMDGEKIKVMGDGSNQRDFLFVDDACNALVAAAESGHSSGMVLNVASGEGTSFIQLAKSVAGELGGSYEFAPFPKDLEKLEPGSFVADISLIKERLGWQPETSLREGIRLTADFYSKHRGHYW